MIWPFYQSIIRAILPWQPILGQIGKICVPCLHSLHWQCVSRYLVRVGPNSRVYEASIRSAGDDQYLG